jgi:hypothetical protein
MLSTAHQDAGNYVQSNKLLFEAVDNTCIPGNIFEREVASKFSRLLNFAVRVLSSVLGKARLKNV